MARGGSRRTYVRDGRGRFASTPGGGPAKTRPAARRAATRAGNRLNRDNSGRITGIGRDGATVRGGRLRTAKGNQRATQTARLKSPGFRAATIARGGRGVSGSVARSTARTQKQRIAQYERVAAKLEKQIKATQFSPGASSGPQEGSREREISRMQRLSVLRNRSKRAAKWLVSALASKPTTPAPVKPAPAATQRAPKARGPRVRLPRMATPSGVIRGSDLAKVKADAQKGIGTPYSRASQRAFARSAREAPLIRRQAIAAAKRNGKTGFGNGPQMNTGSIGNSAFDWTRNGQPATARERLAMWQKGERRNRGFWSGGRGVAGAYAGALRASRRAAELVDLGDRRGNLPTTRKMAEEPRQRRVDRVSQNETQGRLASSDASKRLLPQIQKVREAAQKRIAEGKKPTAAQREKEQRLVAEYNKQVRKLQVAQAAKAYMENPWGFTPQRMSLPRRR